jgi:hypothetical protein
LKFLLFRPREPPLLGELDQFIESLFGPEFRADPLEQGAELPSGGPRVRHQALLPGELGQAATFRALAPALDELGSREFGFGPRRFKELAQDREAFSRRRQPGGQDGQVPGGAGMVQRPA